VAATIRRERAQELRAPDTMRRREEVIRRET